MRIYNVVDTEINPPPIIPLVLSTLSDISIIYREHNYIETI